MRHPLFTTLLLAFLCAAVIPAQNAEVTAAFKQSTFSTGDLGQVGLIPQRFDLQNGTGVNLHFSLNGRSYFGHELTYGYERDTLKLGEADQGSVQVHKFYYDFVAHLSRRGARARPFVLAGAGLASYLPPAEAAIRAANLTRFGLNFGGGLKVRIADHLGVRFDIRDHFVEKPDFFDLAEVTGRLHNIEYAVGLSLLF